MCHETYDKIMSWQHGVTRQGCLETMWEAPQPLEAHSATDWDVGRVRVSTFDDFEFGWANGFVPQADLGMFSGGPCEMPLRPTGYALASFRPQIQIPH